MRQSINVVRLSRIAQSNLEKEGDGSDYTTAEARGSDIRIETADAELDFEEVKEEGERPGQGIGSHEHVLDPPCLDCTQIKSAGSLGPRYRMGICVCKKSTVSRI